MHTPAKANGRPRQTPTTPDHDNEAEQAVLGALLLNPSIAAELTLTTNDFYNPTHATIWQAITTLVSEGHHPDAIVLADRLTATGQLSKIGGGPYLHTLIAAVPTTANAAYYATILAKHTRTRAINHTAARLHHAATIDDPDQQARLLRDLAGELDTITAPPTTGAADPHPPLNWTQLWTDAATEVRWEIEPLAERGHSIAIFSEPKAGKSLLSLEIACALATGRPVLGNPARPPRRVGYVDYENSHGDIHDRLRALGYHPEDLDNLVYFSFPTFAPLDTPTGGRQLHAAATRHNIQVLIIDTIGRTVEGEENDADTWNALYRNSLIPLKADGITVIRLDHTGKDPTRGQRGSSAKDGDVDAVWRLVARTATSIYLKRERTRTGRGDSLVELTRRFEPVRHDRTQAFTSTVDGLIWQMDTLELPDTTGRDAARAALNKAGISVRNDVLSAAIKARRDRSVCPREPNADMPENVIDFTEPRHLSPRSGTAGTDWLVSGTKPQHTPPDDTCPQDPGTAGTPQTPSNTLPPVPNPVPPIGGQGTAGQSPRSQKVPELISCTVCYGPLTDTAGTGRHPQCHPTPDLGPGRP